MKSRHLMIIAALTFCGSFFSACTDEMNEVVPSPLNEDAPATVGTDGGEKHDPME